MNKSFAASFFLTLLFGPIGLFYSSVPAALALVIVAIVLSLVHVALAIFFVLPISIITGFVAVNSHNSRISIEERRHNDLLEAIRAKDNQFT